MFKSILYIENELKNNSVAQQIIQKIQPEHIVFIDTYKEILNQSNTDWQFNKSYQKIILAKRKNEFYYKGSPLTSSIGYKHFYYNTLALNCLYHCEYCYLQGMYNTPHLVLFINNHDFIKATKKLVQQTKDKIYLALSYDTDLPALEKYYPYCQEWIEFANKQKSLTIEIRTKSNHLDFIHHTKPSPNVILSFTLSPEIIQKNYEPFTPSLEQRIKAVKNALNKNFQVMLCIDPIIHISHFKEVYKTFFQKIFSEISPQSLFAVSIGTFRMNKDFFKRIKKNGNPSDIYLYPYEVKNNTIQYPSALSNEMITFVKNGITAHSIKNIFIYE